MGSTHSLPVSCIFNQRATWPAQGEGRRRAEGVLLEKRLPEGVAPRLDIRKDGESTEPEDRPLVATEQTLPVPRGAPEAPGASPSAGRTVPGELWVAVGCVLAVATLGRPVTCPLSLQAATCPATPRPSCWTSTTSRGHPCRGEGRLPQPPLPGLPAAVSLSTSLCVLQRRQSSVPG